MQSIVSGTRRSRWARATKASQDCDRIITPTTTLLSCSTPTARAKQPYAIAMKDGSPFGIAGPNGVDPAFVKIIHDAFKKGAEDPAYLETTAKLDQEPAYMSSDDYRRYVAVQLVEQKG